MATNERARLARPQHHGGGRRGGYTLANLFDEAYHSYFDGYGVYGEPVSVTSTLTYSF